MPVPAIKSLSILAASALLPFTACVAQKAEKASQPITLVAADARLTPEQVRADIELAREAFSRVHPGYTRYATETEMDALWQSIIDRAEAQGGMSLAEFYLAAELALVAIRCDHTKAELPKALREARAGKALYLPMRWRIVEGRAFVEAGAEGQGLNFGDEILSIDGRSMDQLFAEVSGFIPVDGYTNWTRPTGMTASLEFMGGAVDHFGALLWDVPSSATLILRNREGEVRTASVDRMDFDAWSAMNSAGGQVSNFKDAATFERISDDVAYLRVDTFVNYRDPVDPATIYEPIFKALQDEGQTTLILDLRKNGGGSSDASYGLLENVLTQDYAPRKGMFAKTLDLDGIRQHLWTWDKRALDPNPLGFSKQDDGTYALRSFVSDDLRTLKPAKYAFGGDLIVLTSNSNSSGSTNFISWMTEMGRATTVGEKTGGSKEGPTAGIQFTLTLQHSGVRMRLPFFHVKNNVASFEKGLGITPDVPAPMTVEDFLEGRDPAMEAAIALASAG
ncbi:S41 family peptidase [Altererythrobacter lutimaris]|uniref:Tail specific protease domain-containing protein n=1 Tax=Altererythrobacter lutimaris TaxID=2743979 RepID=A0A850H799_9SPHN|nr:S41 family peptidase [Altererythrobacter lutimaris]NVE93639.1 hypothetical protein [Altererythrobacter lutimaris]